MFGVSISVVGISLHAYMVKGITAENLGLGKAQQSDRIRYIVELEFQGIKKHLFSLSNRSSCLHQAETANEPMVHRCSFLINRKQFFLSPPSANH